MIAIIFEVEPVAAHRDAYLDIAAKLRPELEKIDGFISVERFQSITNLGKMLSLSFFQDEAAVRAWRNLESHRRAQEAGRGRGGHDGLFAGYRLRVASVLRDYSLEDREQAPDDSRAIHG